MRLRKPEPVVVAHGKGHVGALEMLDGRDDVEHSKVFDPRGVIEREPMRHACAPVVATDGKFCMAEMRHKLHHVPGHIALGIGGAICCRRRLEGLAIAA